MDTRTFQTALRRARKAERELHTQCSILTEMLQPFFSEEISVLFQPSDGIVVLHDDANLNTQIEEVFNEITNDLNAFL